MVRTLSTMLSRDILWKNRRVSELVFGKIMIIILSLFAILFVVSGYDPQEGIMGTLIKTTFSGLAVLCPTAIAALYWQRATKYGCFASIFAGELLIMIFHFKLLPTLGFLSAIWAITVAIIVLIIVSYLTHSRLSIPIKN